jgi:hypothetical protein
MLDFGIFIKLSSSYFFFVIDLNELYQIQLSYFLNSWRYFQKYAKNEYPQFALKRDQYTLFPNFGFEKKKLSKTSFSLRRM